MNVGCRAIAVRDPVQGVAVPVHVLYPTAAAAAEERFGPYPLVVAREAPVVGDGLVLVAISHGNGGTPWGYRGLAAHLASAGCAVVMIEHPGNSRSDNTRAGTAENLANRPRHVRLALDAVVTDAALGPHVMADRAVVIGHSIGGYTALAVAGGQPMALPDQTADGVAAPVVVEADPRVSAVVLLAPALPWLMAPGALAAVRVPVMVRTGERDELTPPAVVAWILRGLPDPAAVDHQIVAGAGHFAFFAPVPAAMVSPGFPPSQDPPGFDRAAYQPQLYAEVLAFVRAAVARQNSAAPTPSMASENPAPATPHSR